MQPVVTDVDQLARSTVAAAITCCGGGLVNRTNATEHSQGETDAYEDTPHPETNTMPAPCWWRSNCFTLFQSRSPSRSRMQEAALKRFSAKRLCPPS
jgi:hypothetical protein